MSSKKVRPKGIGIAFAKYCNLKDDLSVREILTIWFEQFKKKQDETRNS
jgi:hypothetical protein